MKHRRSDGERREATSIAGEAHQEGSREKRKKRILDNAPRYDLVDLEADRDLAPEIVDNVLAQTRASGWLD